MGRKLFISLFKTSYNIHKHSKHRKKKSNSNMYGWHERLINDKMTYIRKWVLLSIKLSLFISYRQFMEIKRKKNVFRPSYTNPKYMTPSLAHTKWLDLFLIDIFSTANICAIVLVQSTKRRRKKTYRFLLSFERRIDHMIILKSEYETSIHYPRHIWSSFFLFNS